MSEPNPRLAYQELRLALVFNGGVSLAVWMGGVAKELDRFRCAFHRSPEALADDPTLAYYAAVLDAVRSEVLTDVVAGTSAGGINGAMLGYAAGNGKSLEVAGGDAIRDTWHGLGAIEQLLDVGDAPTSALSGDFLFTGCAKVFAELKDTSPDLVDDPAAQVSLTVTATDSAGFDVGERTENTAVDHRLEMRFGHVERPHGAERRLPDALLAAIAALPAAGDNRDGDTGAWPFRTMCPARELRGADAAALLTRAARATASFPIAFAPTELPLVDPSPQLEQDPTGLTATPPMGGVLDTRSGGVTLIGPDRVAVDGGLWDNAPFDTVLEGIDGMAAGRDVDRRLVYIVATNETVSIRPDAPGAEAEQTQLAVRPELRELISPVAHALTVPSNVGFANDLERIAADLAQQHSRQASLASLLVDGAPDVFVLARELFSRYRERLLHEEPDQGVPPPDLDLDPDASLERWGATPQDWKWGSRPVVMAIETARRLLRGVLRGLGPADPAAVQDALTALIEARERLSQLALVLHDSGQLLDSGADQLNGPALRRVFGEAMHALADVVDDLRPTIESLAGLHGEHPATTGQSLTDALQVVLGLSKGGHDVIVQRGIAAEVAIHALSSDHRAHKVDYRFATIRPNNPPAVPTDSAVGGSTPTRLPLSGAAYGHFGGFLRASWRLSDWMWGRLDGSSHMMEMLLDSDQVARLTDGDASRRRELATRLSAVALADSGNEAQQRLLVAEAYAARRLRAGPAMPSALGTLSDPEAEAAPQAGVTRLADLRQGLTDVYEQELAVGALDQIRADLLRPLQLAIIAHEVESLAAAMRTDEEAIPAPQRREIPPVDSLRDTCDGGLGRLTELLRTEVPTRELTELAERVAANLAAAIGHPKVSSWLTDLSDEPRVNSLVHHIGNLAEHLRKRHEDHRRGG